MAGLTNLYEQWLKTAYDDKGASLRKFWDGYMPREQRIYEQMLSAKDPAIVGSVSDLAKRHDMPEVWVAGFLDGVKDALTTELDVESLAADSIVDVRVDFEKLYKKMVQFKAEHLYTLPEWDGVFDEETRRELFRRQKESGTVRREEEKVGRNDPCPCGSGKKYKKCCGA